MMDRRTFFAVIVVSALAISAVLYYADSFTETRHDEFGDLETVDLSEGMYVIRAEGRGSDSRLLMDVDWVNNKEPYAYISYVFDPVPTDGYSLKSFRLDVTGNEGMKLLRYSPTTSIYHPPGDTSVYIDAIDGSDFGRNAYSVRWEVPDRSGIGHDPPSIGEIGQIFHVINGTGTVDIGVEAVFEKNAKLGGEEIVYSGSYQLTLTPPETTS